MTNVFTGSDTKIQRPCRTLDGARWMANQNARNCKNKIGARIIALDESDAVNFQNIFFSKEHLNPIPQ